ncbi:MAG: type III pantothenate kinase, partial [Xanthomonadales bacterium]|nr:type III pantothenate kinase [Xanthomonadales bacterium]
MAERTLLIDQGNTRLKWVVAMDGKIDKKSAGRGDFEAFAEACRSDAFKQPAQVLFSSVAGSEAAQELADFCASQWQLKARQLLATSRSGPVRNGYTKPDELGVDRWLAIVGAVAHYGKPVVVW